MSIILITNNRYIWDKYGEDMEIIYDESLDYMGILELVRDKIHKGHRLLTHPLSGSIKPNETPYKTIMISREIGSLDMDGLNILEESISTARKFLDNKSTPNWTEKVLDDFRTIDLSLIENTMRIHQF